MYTCILCVYYLCQLGYLDMLLLACQQHWSPLVELQVAAKAGDTDAAEAAMEPVTEGAMNRFLTETPFQPG